MRNFHSNYLRAPAIGLSTVLLACGVTSARAGDADIYTTSCGTFTATELQGQGDSVGPASSINLPANGVTGNYQVDLDLTGCTGAQGPAGPPGPAGPAGAPGATGATGPAGPAGPTGPIGPAGADGAPGEKGDKGDPGVAGLDGKDGKDGIDGKDGKDGRDGRDFDLDESLAITAALGMPAWLESGENFSLTGGIGFANGESALGVNGIMRIQGGVSGFAGGAVSDGGGNWAGKAGVRIGW